MKKQFVSCLILSLQIASTYASQTWLNQLIVSKEANKSNLFAQKTTANAFFKQHTLVLFYASHCPYCHQVAPVIQQWAEHQQADVVALSFDNQPLPQFPHFLPATTEWITAAFANQSIRYPALFIVNNDTQALYPVAIGSLTSTELTGRMHQLLPKIKQYEQKEGLA